jgi:signal recognition particle subunit SRP54
MFDALTDRLQGAMRSIRGDAKITPENIEEAIREVRKSLLEADVSLKVVKIFISRVRQKALGAEVLESVSPDQQFIKIVSDACHHPRWRERALEPQRCAWHRYASGLAGIG